MVRPYISTIHNIFDGIILQLIVIISVLPIVEFIDNYDKTLVMAMAYALLLLPVASFITINMLINKNKIHGLIKHLYIKCSSNYVYAALSTDDTDDTDELRNEVTITVDKNTRINATVAAV